MKLWKLFRKKEIFEMFAILIKEILNILQIWKSAIQEK